MQKVNQNTVFDIIKKQDKIQTVVNAILEWHEDCELGRDGKCEIYDAIKSGKSDEEIINIAYDIDADLFDRFNLENTITIRRWEFIPVMFEYNVQAQSLKEAIKKLVDGDDETYKTRSHADRKINFDAEPNDIDEVSFWRLVDKDGGETVFEELDELEEDDEKKLEKFECMDCEDKQETNKTYGFAVIGTGVTIGSFDEIASAVENYISSRIVDCIDDDEKEITEEILDTKNRVLEALAKIKSEEIPLYIFETSSINYEDACMICEVKTEASNTQKEMVLQHEENGTDFILTGERCYITVNNLCVYIKKDEEGVVVDVYPLKGELGEPIGSTWVTYAEGAEDDDESEGESDDESEGESEGEYHCTKCDRWFNDEDIETFSPCICKVCAQDEKDGWKTTDMDCRQQFKKIDENCFLYREDRISNPETGETYVYESAMNFDDYDEDELERGVEAYYKNVDEVKSIYGDKWKQIVLECIFEQE